MKHKKGYQRLDSLTIVIDGIEHEVHERLEIVPRYSDGETYKIETFFVEDFIGDSPEDFGDTFTCWARPE